jgi:predicted phage terminase large subunit-like protein
MTIDKDVINAIACELARKNFYSFCRILYPRFYIEKRKYLKILCDTLQDFYEGKINKDKMMILMPPRHGKSFTVQNFSKWILGRDINNTIITVSYGQSLSIRAGKEVRNAIQEKKIQGGHLVFSDIFPNTKIRDGDGAQDVWALEGRFFSYLSTSPSAVLTGVGTKWLIIDDLTKDANESNNETILDNLWNWYTDTALSRIESGGKQLIINTRWCDKDISGRLLRIENDSWHVVKMPACFDESTGEMLAPDILSYREYIDRKNKTDPLIFSANYQQKILSAQDRLYSGFKTYTQVPSKFQSIHNYTDTADKGSDSLCSITYGVLNNVAYVLDVIFTREPMEITEPLTADTLTKYGADRAFIESNNGGRGFARNVEARMRQNGNHKTVIEAFTQTGNKLSRILTNAYSCTNSIIMPEGWQNMWPEFYFEIMQMSRTGKSKNDDAADSLTGISEKSLSKPDFFFI